MGLGLKKVSVLLSSYNGEMFIETQLDTILNQKDVDVHLYIRDDGSSDRTIPIIEQYCLKYENISFYKGNNIGYAMSFMWLVHNCTINKFDYYAFSDQDDIWDSSKLINAIKLIESKTISEQVALYYSDLKVVDCDGHFIKMANDWEGTIDKYMILTFIGIRGCTVVYNNALQCVLNSCTINKIASHDTFVALVAFWTGSVVYDKNAYINYRQTGTNVSITGTSKIDKIKKNFRYVKRRMTDKAHERQVMAKELLKYDSYCSDRKAIEKVAFYDVSWASTFKLVIDPLYFRHHFLINFINRLLILFKKF